MILYVDKALQRTARKLSKRQRSALAVLKRRGCAQPDRHVAARTLRSLTELCLAAPTGAAESTYVLTQAGHSVARLLSAAA